MIASSKPIPLPHMLISRKFMDPDNDIEMTVDSQQQSMSMGINQQMMQEVYEDYDVDVNVNQSGSMHLNKVNSYPQHGSFNPYKVNPYPQHGSFNPQDRLVHKNALFEKRLLHNNGYAATVYDPNHNGYEAQYMTQNAAAEDQPTSTHSSALYSNSVDVMQDESSGYTLHPPFPKRVTFALQKKRRNDTFDWSEEPRKKWLLLRIKWNVKWNIKWYIKCIKIVIIGSDRDRSHRSHHIHHIIHMVPNHEQGMHRPNITEEHRKRSVKTQINRIASVIQINKDRSLLYSNLYYLCVI
eukprot:879435_1